MKEDAVLKKLVSTLLASGMLLSSLMIGVSAADSPSSQATETIQEVRTLATAPESEFDFLMAPLLDIQGQEGIW